VKKNPYKFKGPLNLDKDKLVLVPRSADLDRVCEGIEKGEYWAILGSRQIGHTTFLRQIMNKMKDALHLDIDFQVCPFKEEHFYPWLVQEFTERIPMEQTKDISKKWEDVNSASKFSRFLKEFKPKKNIKKIFLLFDEIEGIPGLAAFLRIWREIFITRDAELKKRYAVVIAGSSELISLTEGKTSPFNIADKFYMRDFSPEESRLLIEEPFAQLNIKINPFAKEKLLSQVNGHPQLLQHACHLLVDIAVREKRGIVEKDIVGVLNTLLKTNDSIATLKKDITENSDLNSLIQEIFAGKKERFHLYKEFSIKGAGCIVEDEDGNCAIRNKVYEKFLRDFFGKDFDIFLIKEKSPDHFFDKKSKKALPYCLKQIQVKNYYGIKETGISNIPLDTPWIFLTGENSFGKTIFLQALAIGLFGNRDEDTILAEHDTKISVEVRAEGENLVNHLGDKEFKPFTHFAAYGSSRLEIQSQQTKNEISEKSTTTYGLFNTDGVLLNIESDLLIWYYKKDPKFEIVKQTLLELLPHMADIIVTKKDEVVYIEKESQNGETYAPLPFNKLASGHKSIIAMVGDILIRLYRKNPMVLYPKKLGGIVIIDELDLHLHPKWQRKLPILLSQVFPKVQFIVSTHSEIPLLGAPENSIFLKVTRNKKDGIRVERVDIKIQNLLPNSILTSDIFDMEEITQVNNESIDEVRTEDFYKEIIQSDQIREKLKAHKEKAAKFPRLSRIKGEKDKK
jgi:predicted ATP-binding protein involved in virulence